jgi:hypothetical protein
MYVFFHKRCIRLDLDQLVCWGYSACYVALITLCHPYNKPIIILGTSLNIKENVRLSLSIRYS